jgi:hypothetical protein
MPAISSGLFNKECPSKKCLLNEISQVAIGCYGTLISICNFFDHDNRIKNLQPFNMVVVRKAEVATACNAWLHSVATNNLATHVSTVVSYNR